MNTVFDTLTTSGILLLVVLGLWLVLGLMDIINLALTGFMTVGVYATVSIFSATGSLWLGVAVGVVSAAILGLIVETVIVRRLYHRPLDTILATWGLSLVITQAVSLIYGLGYKNLPTPLSGTHWLNYSAYRLLLLIFAIVVVGAFLLLVRFSRAGLIIRMVIHNEPLARSAGVNTTRVRRWTFVMGAALAGFAGAVIGPTEGISPQYAADFLAPAFLVVLLAGRSLWGLVAACVVIGLTETLFDTYSNPVYGGVAVIVVAVFILRFMPQGITWRRT